MMSAAEGARKGHLVKSVMLVQQQEQGCMYWQCLVINQRWLLQQLWQHEQHASIMQQLPMLQVLKSVAADAVGSAAKLLPLLQYSITAHCWFPSVQCLLLLLLLLLSTLLTAVLLLCPLHCLQLLLQQLHLLLLKQELPLQLPLLFTLKFTQPAHTADSPEVPTAVQAASSHCSSYKSSHCSSRCCSHLEVCW
jgi:hypothetical protein